MVQCRPGALGLLLVVPRFPPAGGKEQPGARRASPHGEGAAATPNGHAAAGGGGGGGSGGLALARLAPRVRAEVEGLITRLDGVLKVGVPRGGGLGALVWAMAKVSCVPGLCCTPLVCMPGK